MKLEDLRQQIDKIDKEIISLLKKRFLFTRQVGEIKKEQGLAVFDESREKEIISKLEEQAKDEGLSDELIEKIYTEIFRFSKEDQLNIK